MSKTDTPTCENCGEQKNPAWKNCMNCGAPFPGTRGRADESSIAKGSPGHPHERGEEVGSLEDYEKTEPPPTLGGNVHFPMELEESFVNPVELKRTDFAFIFKAEQISPKQTVALKISRHGIAKDFIGGHEKEATIMGQLNNCPNIVSIFAVINNVIVMEYMDKGSLADILCIQALPEDEVVGIMLEITKGLRDIHEHGLVHLDLKPHNILMNSHGQVKITDFGYSREAIILPQNIPLERAITFEYRAPEKELGFYSDIYSLGMTCITMLTGNFTPKSGGFESLRGKLNPEFNALLKKMISDKPEKRPTVDEVYQTLSKLLSAESRYSRPSVEQHHVPEVQFISISEMRTKKIKKLESSLKFLPQWSQKLISAIDQYFQQELPEWKVENLLYKGYIPRWLNIGEDKGSWVSSFFALADYDLKKLWVTKGLMEDDPAWYSEFLSCKNAQLGKVFVLYGNINDYFFDPDKGYILLRDFLENQLEGNIIFYNLSKGISKGNASKSNIGPDVPYPAGGDGDKNDDLWAQVKRDFLRLDQDIRNPINDGVTLLIENIDKLFPAGIADLEREFLVDMILRWAVDRTIPANNSIILTTTNYDGLHMDLRSRVNRIHPIEVDRPTENGRLKFLIYLYYSTQANADSSMPSGLQSPEFYFSSEFGSNKATELEVFATITSGLNLMGINDLINRAILENRGMVELSDVSYHKRNLLKGESAGILEMVDSRFGLDQVRGLKAPLKRLRYICKALRNQDPRVRVTIPIGILFLGPPGTGKSLVAEAMAQESNLSLVKLGNIRGMYVGESEKNMSVALNLIRSLAPVIVFIDEIDQVFSSREDKNQTGPDKRLFAKLLEIMGDSSLRGKVLWIGASNSPEGLDEALKRAGRFDLKLPFFRPDRDEIAPILELKLAQNMVQCNNTLNNEDKEWLADKMDGFSGAEIEVVVNECVRLAINELFIDGKPSDEAATVKINHFVEVLDNYNPERAMRKYEEIEKNMIKEFPNKDLLPERWKDYE